MGKMIDQRQQRHDPANKQTTFPDDPAPADPQNPVTPPGATPAERTNRNSPRESYHDE
ncbi:hypothetical protein [Falsirhodobacter algicola]|uniref:Uncharacterized protein n=1 Tax=Falsirhodobacter algicola TaxID=2692330 RepID=A0A8J8MS13_9RHOB|nr:hypothetical protein [Falsirhodobacter algicola]QUS35641.1 hypothetical protein GR316_04765 [Falsirhodobacter algicola]